MALLQVVLWGPWVIEAQPASLCLPYDEELLKECGVAGREVVYGSDLEVVSLTLHVPMPRVQTHGHG